jgi:hypothetical protein
MPSFLRDFKPSSLTLFFISPYLMSFYLLVRNSSSSNCSVVAEEIAMYRAKTSTCSALGSHVASTGLIVVSVVTAPSAK